MGGLRRPGLEQAGLLVLIVWLRKLCEVIKHWGVLFILFLIMYIIRNSPMTSPQMLTSSLRLNPLPPPNPPTEQGLLPPGCAQPACDGERNVSGTEGMISGSLERTGLEVLA